MCCSWGSHTITHFKPDYRAAVLESPSPFRSELWEQGPYWPLLPSSLSPPSSSKQYEPSIYYLKNRFSFKPTQSSIQSWRPLLSWLGSGTFCYCYRHILLQFLWWSCTRAWPVNFLVKMTIHSLQAVDRHTEQWKCRDGGVLGGGPQESFILHTRKTGRLMVSAKEDEGRSSTLIPVRSPSLNQSFENSEAVIKTAVDLN